MVTRDEVSEMVQRIMREAPFSMRQWADDASMKYSVLRAWASGKRTPRSENLHQLADGLRARAAKLEGLAAELDRAGEGGE